MNVVTDSHSSKRITFSIYFLQRITAFSILCDLYRWEQSGVNPFMLFFLDSVEQSSDICEKKFLVQLLCSAPSNREVLYFSSCFYVINDVCRALNSYDCKDRYICCYYSSSWTNIKCSYNIASTCNEILCLQTIHFCKSLTPGIFKGILLYNQIILYRSVKSS